MRAAGRALTKAELVEALAGLPDTTPVAVRDDGGTFGICAVTSVDARLGGVELRFDDTFAFGAA
jgi:hypothetical protein